MRGVIFLRDLLFEKHKRTMFSNIETFKTDWFDSVMPT